MTLQLDTADAVVIGGGFYGSVIAIYLAKIRGLRRVILLEREPELLIRASYNNQARIHNGYHYPRDYTTAYRSRVNMPRFVLDWSQAIKQDFTKLYAIPRRNSKLTAKQFESFCHDIGAKIKPAGTEYKRLFDYRLIENIYLVDEYVFDSSQLADLIVEDLNNAGVEVHYSTQATAISHSSADKNLKVSTQPKLGNASSIICRYVFNCTYSGLNQFLGDFPGTQADLKQELTEMALIQVPDELKQIGITVMDGPFFSMMPFPDRGLHTLSHVRYTPHFEWKDKYGVDPYKKLDEYNRETRVNRMVRDAGRYLPLILKAKYIDSLFEIKTVLIKNEENDGRPILFEKYAELPSCYSIMGGKIDNIYDILEKLDIEEFNNLQE